MSSPQVVFSVFAKPWHLPIPELGRLVSSLGFDGVELPVRPGFQVTPENVARELPLAARQLADYGLRVYSIADPTDEATIAACAEAGVPTIRIMVRIGAEGYLATEAQTLRNLDALVPLLEKYGVQVGIQNHCGDFVSSAIGLRRLFERYDRRYVAAIWDVAHDALCGEGPEHALDIVWDHLCMVNLKNALWQRTGDSEAGVAEWHLHWVTGGQGLASWPRAVAELKCRAYTGVVCLTAEYDDHDAATQLVAKDVAMAKALFA